MRPVNLIPPEERRGERAPLRTGAAPYLIVAVLAVALAALSGVVLTSNQVKDREAAATGLRAELAAVSEQAEALRPYADFAALEQARTATVTSLAQSRFDWERVLRELALVIPSDVWLVELSGTVNSAVTIEGGSDLTLRDQVPGPALAIVGCAASHEAVARFVEALEDIDGVTRVGVSRSERSTAASGEGTSDSECRTRDFISRFEIVAAFDEVPTPAAATATPAPSAVPTGGTSEIADAQAQEQAAADSAAAQTGEAQEAAAIVPGVAQ